jgi:hypothetical protein
MAFFPQEREISSPSPKAEVVSPSDSTNFAYDARAIYVGGGGNVAVVFPDNSVVLFSGVLAGSIIPVIAKRVNSTNTTATSMVALY